MDTLTKKVTTDQALTGPQGQAYLASGERIALRRWHEQPGDAKDKDPHTHDYETVGYVLKGRAEVRLDGETLMLEEGDSWVVPAGVEHTYRIHSEFEAIEATTPPARNN